MKRHGRQKLRKMLEDYRRTGKVNGMKLFSEADVYLLWKVQNEIQRRKETRHDNHR